jgi:hypothetical protein
MATPRPAGSAKLPAADAATCKLTARVAPTAPICRAVVRVTSGKTGAAARPVIIMPVTARTAGPGTAMTAVPKGTPATAPASRRRGPTRSAAGPRMARPANIVAQYAETAAPAAPCDRPRPAVRKR